jgi:hypothetical protein
MRREELTRGIEHVDAKIFGSSDHATLAERLHHLAIPPSADFGEAGYATDRLFALFGATTQRRLAMPSSVTIWETSSP